MQSASRIDPYDPTAAFRSNTDPTPPRLNPNALRIAGALERNKAEPLSTEEFHRLLVAAAETPNATDVVDVATLLAFTGLRPSELCFLRWSDVHFEDATVVAPAKKRRARRPVPLSRRPLQVLAARRERSPEAKYVLGDNPRRVLETIAQQLRVLSPAIRKEPITLQALSVTFMRRWIECGLSLRLLAMVTGYGPSRSLIQLGMRREQQFAAAAALQSQLDDKE